MNLPSVGDRVVVHGEQSTLSMIWSNLGTVRFVGSLDCANGDDWCGIEMDDRDVGDNDGTVNGKTYFITERNMALLVRATAVQSLSRQQDLDATKARFDYLRVLHMPKVRAKHKPTARDPDH